MVLVSWDGAGVDYLAPNFRFMNLIKNENTLSDMESYEFRLLDKLPICMDWVKFKGEDVVAIWNFEATGKAGRPMVDIAYCMTKALNGVFFKTVRWDKRFSPSKLGKQW